jgi:catechol 2,3-dioxygenase
MRAGHVQIRVLDLEKTLKHYTEIVGLTEVARDEMGRVYLKAWDEFDHHSVILREADKPGMDFMGFKVTDNAALLRIAEDLTKLGIAVEEIAAGEMLETGRRIAFTAPTGHRFELYAQKKMTGNGISTTNPDVRPATQKGMRAVTFDHCLLYGDDIDANAKLFTEVLGFYVSEKIIAGDGKTLIGIFLTCSSKTHDVAFIRCPEKDRFHHISFNLESWHDIGNAADLISSAGVELDIGPTRHGISRGHTIYFFDPSGNRNEVFSGGYHYYPDRPTLVWTEDQIGKAIFYYERKINERFLARTT